MTGDGRTTLLFEATSWAVIDRVRVADAVLPVAALIERCCQCDGRREQSEEGGKTHGGDATSPLSENSGDAAFVCELWTRTADCDTPPA